MWLESSSINAVNLAKKSATVTEISNFSYGGLFFWRALYNWVASAGGRLYGSQVPEFSDCFDIVTLNRYICIRPT